MPVFVLKHMWYRGIFSFVVLGSAKLAFNKIRLQ
jgi:hypothetical protein